MKDPVVQVGDPVLRERALPVAKADIGTPRLRNLIKKMKDTLVHEEYGVAIAAPQVGEALRIFVIAGRAFEKDEEDEPEFSKRATGQPSRAPKERAEEMPASRVFINPELIKLSRKKREMSEGCLSVRGKYGTVMRHEKASVKALDESGKPFTFNGTGLIAHIFQHEVDHLDGILYIDKAVKLEDEDMREELRAAHPA